MMEQMTSVDLKRPWGVVFVDRNNDLFHSIRNSETNCNRQNWHISQNVQEKLLFTSKFC